MAKKPELKLVKIAIYLDAGRLENLDALADKTNMARSVIVRMLVNDGLDKVQETGKLPFSTLD